MTGSGTVAIKNGTLGKVHEATHVCALTLGAPSFIGVSCEASATSAVPTVIASTAISIGSTITWINTLLIPAGQVVRTVRIDQALVGSTMSIGVSFMVWQTVAVGSVVLWFAYCIDTTGFVKARILTLSLDAGLVQRTFIVTLAAS